MIRLALACALACAALGCTRACKDGTLFLTVDYGGAAATGDQVDLTLTLAGKSETEHFAPSGGAVDTLEIDFPQGYPAGAALAIQAVATRGGAQVGSGSLDATLADGCSALTVTLGSPGADQAVPRDLALADLTGRDLAVPPDFAQPLDFAGVDLAGIDFATPPDLTQVRALSFSAALGFKGVNGPHAIAAALLDGDAKLDLAVTEYAGSTGQNVWVATGKGDGTFSNPLLVACGQGPVAVVASDFDGDGRVDLATVNNASSDLTWMRNKGGLLFDPPRTIAQANLAAAGADLNGDGRGDVLATWLATGSIHSFVGSGNGLQSVGLFGVLDIATAIASADLDGDGKADAVCALMNNGVAVVRGQGNGQFAAATSFNGAAKPAALVLADFDGDGALDAAVLSSSVAEVDLLRGDGKGNLGAPSAITLPAMGGTSLVIADFDGDGKPDLAAAAGGKIYVLAGRGDGTFQPAYAVPSATAAMTLVAGDWNVDGRIDLASADETASTVTIFTNTTM